MVIVKLTCGHSVELNSMYVRDDAGEEYCPKHRGWMLVMGAWPEHWHSLCNDCSYHKPHGKSRLYADRAATAHHLQTLHRTYIAWYSDAPKDVRRAVVRKEPVVHPSQDMLPPF